MTSVQNMVITPGIRTLVYHGDYTRSHDRVIIDHLIKLRYNRTKRKHEKGLAAFFVMEITSQSVSALTANR